MGEQSMPLQNEEKFPKVQTVSTYYLSSSAVIKYSDKQPKRERAYSSSWFKGAAHHGGEIKAVGA